MTVDYFNFSNSVSITFEQFARNYIQMVWQNSCIACDTVNLTRTLTSLCKPSDRIFFSRRRRRRRVTEERCMGRDNKHCLGLLVFPVYA